MALLLAPYNSAMRLGMGFNSYTQAMCVNDVVRKPGNEPATDSDLRAAELTAQTDAASLARKQPQNQATSSTPEGVLTSGQGSVARIIKDGQKEISQAVSWEATFVENSSDLLSKLDVNGALTIKLAALGEVKGQAQFLDSTETRQADINYFIRVKVVNQRLMADNITQFTPIPHVEPGQFTEVYGDCFISSFIEGGEFTALVSITTLDTMKQNHLGGSLELTANISGVDVAGKVGGNKDENSALKNAKTTINVAWSGGGDIRDDSMKEWTLQSLKETAMSFPDAVAACPQRTSAILTKYASLRSYHEETVKGSPLDYENAGVYTASLYDAYMDYKVAWKDIQAMKKGLNRKEIELFSRGASDGLTKFAKEMKQIQLDKEKQYAEAVAAEKSQREKDALGLIRARPTVAKRVEKPQPANEVIPYDADVFGLENAARECRFEMIKIVREVDAVTQDPKVACDPARTLQYLSPDIFRLLMPTPFKDQLPSLKEWINAKDDLVKKEQNIKEREGEINDIKKKLEAALITPRGCENESLQITSANTMNRLHSDICKSLSKLAYRADRNRMQVFSEDTERISTGASFFNDLEVLEVDARPSELKFWNDATRITGISIVYTSGREVSHGIKNDTPKEALKLAFSEVITEVEVEIGVRPGEENKLSVTRIAVATSNFNILTAGTMSGGKVYSFSMVDQRQWSFRGFFGFTFDDGFEDLGIVWGKDVLTAATTSIQAPAARNLLGMGSALQEKTRKAMAKTKPVEHFYLGDCVATGPSSSSANAFSALDSPDGLPTISKLAFAASSGRLSGLKVDYGNNKQLIHGAYPQTQEAWSCVVKSPIVAAKITVGKTISMPEPFIDSVEFVCGEEQGQMPLWPLDVSTIRYLGVHGDGDTLDITSKLTEQAPKLAGGKWTLRGFYGEESHGLITRLGLIWGRG